ncbi:MAG: pyridoxamine 5'-phosphate oxidase family protein [Pseudomonadales bacterium]|jgi:predicted pyridoxine 5'-phosphate oxidase superfamily flavin-nucleotide-binding protein|nr:pyridoxamine 5'-phosphate oxidase family protein [Pseudomonadales bacterium]
MTEFYTEAQLELQQALGTRALAERLEAAIVTPELTAEQIDFVHARDMFFLSTVDADGFPSVSYKGGAPGFVRCIDAGTLVFPNYDGNGMFLSLGNVVDRGRVGLLFVDFEAPHRIRVRGDARLVREGPLLASYPGADAVVEVRVERAWENCPRYVHRMERVERSRYVPDAAGEAPFPAWKRIDVMQDVLGGNDRAKAQGAGLITAADYEALMQAERG